jgi:hypothetical protein
MTQTNQSVGDRALTGLRMTLLSHANTSCGFAVFSLFSAAHAFYVGVIG